MKKLFILTLFALLSGCATNPIGSNYELIKTPAFDHLFIASIERSQTNIHFKSLAVMYRDKMPAISTIKNSMIITDKEVFLSEWQPSSYTFKHKVRIPFSEIVQVKDTTIERKVLPNAQQLQIITKRNEIYNFVILENQASYAKTLIENNM